MNAATLEPPDIHFLNAAQGWFELGDSKSASEELEHIAEPLHLHPDVLEVRWQILAKEQQWAACVDVATTFTRLAPNRAMGWIHRSYALHELNRTQEAWDTLLPVAGQFADDFLIRYNLACYACQLGRLAQAREWLQAAVKVSGEPARVKAMALADSDLEPLWVEISKW